MLNRGQRARGQQEESNKACHRDPSRLIPEAPVKSSNKR
jgi:hypothetical protein